MPPYGVWFVSQGGDPGIVDDCSVAASDLNGVLQDLGVILNPTQTAFLIQVRFGSRCTFTFTFPVTNSGVCFPCRAYTSPLSAWFVGHDTAKPTGDLRGT